MVFLIKKYMFRKLKFYILRIAPFLKEIILDLQLKNNKKKINNYSCGSLRAGILRFYSGKLKDKIEQINYQQGILVYRGQIYVLSDGIFLNTKGNNRYFKVPADCPGNQGRAMYDFLISKNIIPNTMVDLGANYGEIALYFCKQNPGMKILAVEASPKNFQILKLNVKRRYHLKY